MPTLATGRSESRAGTRRASGFTLLEILVVMVILGLLAVSVNLTLPDPARQAEAEAAAACRRQAELAARLADGRAGALALELGERGLNLLENRDALWLPLATPPQPPAQASLALPEGLRVSGLEIDGRRIDLSRAESRRIVFQPGQPPLFRLDLTGQHRHWRIDGLPNGHIELHDEAAS